MNEIQWRIVNKSYNLSETVFDELKPTIFSLIYTMLCAVLNEKMGKIVSIAYGHYQKHQYFDALSSIF